MLKPQGYDQAQAYDGSSQRLPAGGYICRVRNASEAVSKAGREMLVLEFDIEEGDYAGYYQRRFSRAHGFLPKWGGVIRTVICQQDGSTNPRYKGIITAWEESNSRKVNWSGDYSQLSGGLIGLVFGEEEYEDTTNQIRTSCKAQYALSVDRIRSGDYTVPSLKKLDDEKKQEAGTKYAEKQGFTNVDVDSDELPF